MWLKAIEKFEILRSLSIKLSKKANYENGNSQKLF